MSLFIRILRGYMQTMLYGIEQRPTYKMDQSFYFLLHIVNHFQYIAIIIQTTHETPYNDFKMNYMKSFMEFFILNNLLKSSMSYGLAFALILFSFITQLGLVLLLTFSTFIRIWTSNLIKKDQQANVNSKVQIWVMSFNENLHWYFVVYPVVYLQIAVISFSSIQCNSLSLIPYSECSITFGIQFLAIIPLIISYIHGQILIYIMRNHRFNETNSLKRRYSSLLLINNSVILVEVAAHYIYEFESADLIKYIMANIFALSQIIDQLTNFPYRDPIRVPSIRLAFSYFWIVIMLTFYRFFPYNEENLFFLIVVPLPLCCVIGEAISSLFQQHAILNYNSNSQIEEKHIIIAVDQFYKCHTEFLKSAEIQLQYFQFIMIHRLYCKNRKCYSQFKKFSTIDVNQKKDLNALSLSIIKCIFKAAQKWLFSMQPIDQAFNRQNINQDLQFEQLQLQYISFVSEVALKPLVGYIELRQYQNSKTNNNSIYFVEITNKLADQLQKQIIDNQNRMNSNAVLAHEQRTQLIEISLTQQWWTQNLYENLLQTYLKVIEMKIQHWQDLVNGYPNLNPFQRSTQRMCEKIDQLKNELDEFIGVPPEWFDLKTTSAKGIIIKKMTHAQLNINVVTLKLYALFYSLLMNDFDRTSYIEQYIKDLTSNDRQKEIDIIDNISLISDNTTIILVSIVKQKGKIVNKNQLALANFFHYVDASDFKDQVVTVHHLLPKPMIQAHELLIDKFVQTGHSEFFIRKISGYYETKKGFIEKGYVKLGNLFEELSDYVITASVLKCNISNQVILVNMEGKIIGISEEFYMMLKEKIPKLDLEFIREYCHFFLILPQFLPLLKMLIEKNISSNDHDLIEDEEYLFYVPYDLIEINTQFVRQQYESLGHCLNSFESQNLSSWRSWKSETQRVNQGIGEKEKFSVFNKDNLSFHFEFLNNHKKLFQKYFIIKTRLKLQFQQFKIKNYQFPYFIIELDHLIVIDNSHKHFTRYPSNNQIIDTATLSNQQYFIFRGPESIQDSADYTKNLSEQGQTQKQRSDGGTRRYIDHNKIKQLIMQDDSNILYGFDHSQIRLIDSAADQKDLNDISVASRPQIHDLPIKKEYDNEEDQELIQLDRHFEDIQQQDNVESNSKINEEEKDDSQLEIVDNFGKHSSNLNERIENRNDLLDILKQNRKFIEEQGEHNVEEEEAKKKRSIASSSRTSTSKSPCLLVRSLYQVSSFQGSIKQIIVGIVLFLILQFTLVFVKMSLIQSNYNILQTNINFVTYPETLNFYFLKTGMLSWEGILEKLNIMDYSDYIKKQNYAELQLVKEEIYQKLNELYQGIMQYEKEILDSSFKLVSINSLNINEQSLDLTQLIHQIELHAFSYIENFSNSTSTIISDALFFRLNLPYVYQFAYKYITYLNNNLVYYEDKIINDIVVLTMIYLGAFTLILLYLIYSTNDVTQYERQILMLITRVSQKTAEDIIDVLNNAKQILIEPSQLLWKRVNYFDLTYDSYSINDLNEKIITKSGKEDELIQKSKTKAFQQYQGYQEQKSVNSTKRSFTSSSLAQRIYDLTLTDYINYIALILIWFLAVSFIIGGIIVTITQISDIKPTLNLNLQLIRFKLRCDSIVVQGEILKTQKMVEEEIVKQTGQTLDLKSEILLQLFNEQSTGFLDAMNVIYDSLASQGGLGLLAAQKQQLLIYFEKSYCLFMKNEIPFCSIEDQSAIPDSFIQEYGKPWPQDNNYDYLSHGLIGAIQEFTKTLQMYFTEELNFTMTTQDEATIKQFLNSSVHINQFTEYFLDTGKLLTLIGYNLYEQNQQKLNQATTIMQLYIYLTGISLTIILLIISYIWLRRLSKRLRMMRLSLTLIPYEVLIEPKTMSSLKQLGNS